MDLRECSDRPSTNRAWYHGQVDATTGLLLIPDPPETAPAALRNPQPGGGKLTALSKFSGVAFGVRRRLLTAFLSCLAAAYHNNDYTFFWENVRANVAERVAAFVSKAKL